MTLPRHRLLSGTEVCTRAPTETIACAGLGSAAAARSSIRRESKGLRPTAGADPPAGRDRRRRPRRCRSTVVVPDAWTLSDQRAVAAEGQESPSARGENCLWRPGLQPSSIPKGTALERPGPGHPGRPRAEPIERLIVSKARARTARVSAVSCTGLRCRQALSSACVVRWPRRSAPHRSRTRVAFGSEACPFRAVGPGPPPRCRRQDQPIQITHRSPVSRVELRSRQRGYCSNRQRTGMGLKDRAPSAGAALACSIPPCRSHHAMRWCCSCGSRSGDSWR